MTAKIVVLFLNLYISSFCHISRTFTIAHVTFLMQDTYQLSEGEPAPVQVHNNHTYVVAHQQKDKQVDHAAQGDLIAAVACQQRVGRFVVGLDRQGQAQILELLPRIFNVFHDALEGFRLGRLQLSELLTLGGDEANLVQLLGLCSFLNTGLPVQSKHRRRRSLLSVNFAEGCVFGRCPWRKNLFLNGSGYLLKQGFVDVPHRVRERLGPGGVLLRKCVRKGSILEDFAVDA